jgi:catechol-2,3-dioxygenase
MVHHLKETGVEILQVRENTYSVGVYFDDPDGNGLEVYYEEPGEYRRAWEGQYARKLLV